VSAQALLTSQLLPPLLLAWGALLGGLLAWRRAPRAGALAVLAALGLLALGTPLAAGSLRAGLEAAILPALPGAAAPGAIIILGAEAREGPAGHEPGPLTLERLRAGAALARASGLPVLVTGGVVSRNGPPVARLMAESLLADFGVPARWVEGEAADTRGNARLSAAMLRQAGVGSAHLVTHGWHMRRAQEAFARAGLPVRAAPARLGLPGAAWHWPDLVPRPDNWGTSWFMLREWAGLWTYRLRDGGAP